MARRRGKKAKRDEGCGCVLFLGALWIAFGTEMGTTGKVWAIAVFLGVSTYLWSILFEGGKKTPAPEQAAADPTADLQVTITTLGSGVSVPSGRSPYATFEDTDLATAVTFVERHDADWSAVPLDRRGMAATGEVADVVFAVQGSAPEPYTVTFFRSGARAWATCTCPAGRKSQHVCRHRTAVLDQEAEVRDLVRGTELGAAWAAYQAAVAADEGERDNPYWEARYALRDAMLPPRQGGPRRRRRPRGGT